MFAPSFINEVSQKAMLRIVDNLVTRKNQGSRITQSIESNAFRFMFNNVCFRPETRLRALIEDD